MDEGIKIRFKAESTRGSIYKLKIKSERGNIEVNPNKLQLLYIYSEKNEIIKPSIYYRKNLITNHFILKKGETFECIFSLISQSDEMERIYLLPSDFIIYNEDSLVKDTIKINSFWSNI